MSIPGDRSSRVRRDWFLEMEFILLERRIRVFTNVHSYDFSYSKPKACVAVFLS